MQAAGQSVKWRVASGTDSQETAHGITFTNVYADVHQTQGVQKAEANCISMAHSIFAHADMSTLGGSLQVSMLCIIQR